MKSLASRIALKFSLVITFLILLLSVSLLLLLRRNIRAREKSELTAAAQQIERTLAGVSDFSNLSPAALDQVPYYLTYTVYAAGNGHILATNDPFLPILPLTNGRTERYTRKNYYTDGDLNVLYYAKVFRPEGSLAVQTVLNMDQDTAEQLLSYLPRSIALIFIPLLLLSYGAAFLIARQTLSPVSRMTQSARKISSSNLDGGLPVSKRGDELDRLAGTFNSLFSRLKADFDRERSFTSDVSHELKTPIAVILGQANLIRRWGKNDPVQLEKSIASLISESHSMEAVVTNLLQLSRLENGSVTPTLRAVAVLPLLSRLSADTHGWSPDTTFDFSGVAESVTVQADPELLYQVYTVIVSNSVKFSPAPVHITVTAAISGDQTELSFCDDGPGFSVDILPHVFERFYRGDPSHHRGAGGSGLGLSIAQEILHVMKGTLAASSLVPPLHGAVITLTLKSGSILKPVW